MSPGVEDPPLSFAPKSAQFIENHRPLDTGGDSAASRRSPATDRGDASLQSELECDANHEGDFPEAEDPSIVNVYDDIQDWR